jgi:hypothetical protein
MQPEILTAIVTDFFTSTDSQSDRSLNIEHWTLNIEHWTLRDSCVAGVSPVEQTVEGEH